MKKLMLMIALVAGLGLFAKAQDKAPKTPELKAAKQTKALTKQLGLTNGQIPQVNAVLLAQVNSQDSLKALKGTNDKKEQRYSHKLIHNQTQAKLNAILTPEQQTKFVALAQAKKEKKMDIKKGAVPAPAAQN
jgi:Spy/CpxP family protein refolding chaperone